MTAPHSLSAELFQSIPISSSRRQHWKRRNSSQCLGGFLDRVNVLSGHQGCVNALSWARDGELLLSGGDDTTVRIWRIDATDTEAVHPLVCRSVISTGHTANIFNAQMLPFSTRIATVAGDKQVRLFDVGDAAAAGIIDGSAQAHGSSRIHYLSRDRCLCILKCHADRVKKIVTEESPDLFLTVSEDGTARQHDLRAPHICGNGGCPAPLINLPIELNSISLSPLTPYQFVVGGESAYGYLFDRRHVGRYIEEEWGLPPDVNQATTCVRRFGRPRVSPARKGRERITGVRVSAANGHEVLLSYIGDAVYLYSTIDDPDEDAASKQSPHVPANKQDIAQDEELQDVVAGMSPRSSTTDNADHAEIAISESIRDIDEGTMDAESPNEHEVDFEDEVQELIHHSVPVIMPRLRFAGACNVRTIKDVNFLGPNDEYVVSGSDDGNWFIWHKNSAQLSDILEGDGTVVNVIEAHPHLPVVAISGIDHTIKLFAPTDRQGSYSKISAAQGIVERNMQTSERPVFHSVSLEFARILTSYGIALSTLAGALEHDVDELEPQCRPQ